MSDEFDWPEFQVERLSISSQGDIELDGGWLNLPEQVTLDFYGFKLDISEVGFGTEEGGDRQWLGITGSIHLVEGLPLGASVEGMKISWNKSGAPDVRVTLEGIGVHLEIPGTLVLDGSVAYEKIESSDTNKLRGDLFKGHVRVNLLALKAEVAGELMIGKVTNTVTNEEFTAFLISMI